MSLLSKLHKIQSAVDKFAKDGSGHGYNYTSGDQVLNKIRPLMNEHGLLLKQEVTEVKNTRYDYTTGNGKEKSEIFTETTQLFTWIDVESGETHAVRWAANGMNDWDKGLGSALTYGERYFLLKFFHVPTDSDDPDTRPQRGAGPKQYDDGRPWLNKTVSKNSDELTEEWIKVTEAVRNGYTIGQVESKYKLNKTIKAELSEIAGKGAS